MTKDNDYASLVKQAEQAVASVKDPELKKVAFEKVLDDLLSSGPGGKSDKKEPPKKTKGVAKPKKKGSRARGPKGYIRNMADDGFFKKPKTIAQVKAELGQRGHHIPLTSLSGPLQGLCQDRILRRQKKKTSGNKETYVYSEW